MTTNRRGYDNPVDATRDWLHPYAPKLERDGHTVVATRFVRLDGRTFDLGALIGDQEGPRKERTRLETMRQYWQQRPEQKQYSQHTKDAHGAVIDTAFRGGTQEEFVLALRQLATMVHCDLTGELREPHTLVPLEPPKRHRWTPGSRTCDNCGKDYEAAMNGEPCQKKPVCAHGHHCTGGEHE